MTLTDAQALSAQREIDIGYARKDFLEYVLEVKPDYKVSWFNQIVCDRLTKLHSEEGKRIKQTREKAIRKKAKRQFIFNIYEMFIFLVRKPI